MKYFTKINDKLHLTIVTQERQYPIFKINGEIDSYEKLSNLTDGDDPVDLEYLLTRIKSSIDRCSRYPYKIEEYRQYYNRHQKNGFVNYLDESHLMIYKNQFRHRLGIIPVSIPGAICVDNTGIFDIVIDPPPKEVPMQQPMKVKKVPQPEWNNVIHNYNRVYLNQVDMDGVNLPENVDIENHEN